MTTEKYIKELQRSNIFISVQNGELKVSAREDSLTKEMLKEIKSRKGEILEFYNNFKSNVNYTPISPAKKEPYYPLSLAQKRLYFIYTVDKDSLAYNLPQAVVLTGALDENKLKNAFRNLFARYEILRTSFEIIDGSVVQKINKDVELSITSHEVEETQVQSLINDFIRPFDLSQAPLIRVRLLKIKHDSNILVVDMHHIITDGTSQAILIKDFMAFYNGKLTGEVLQYKDYSEWQRGEQYRSLLDKEKKFWLREYSEGTSALDLPFDYPRQRVMDYSGSAISFSLGEDETTRLQGITRNENATMFITVLSIFNILLSKISNQEQIVIGTPVAGRVHADLHNMMGLFLNTLAIRTYASPHLGFREFLSSVKEKTLACFDHQSYPFEQLIEDLKIPFDEGRHPLVDVMFVFQNFQTEQLTLPGLTIRPHVIDRNISKFYLSLIVVESNGQLNLTFEYSTKLFAEATVKRFIGYFRCIVREITANPDVKLSEINVVSDDEKALFKKFNDTFAEYPKDKTVIDLFEDQVRKTPGATALIFENVRATYTQLNTKANSIAEKIRVRGVNESSKVALLFTTSIEMIAAMLGVLKCGCAYVPLSLNSPAERNNYILRDSAARLLLAPEVILDDVYLDGLSINRENILGISRGVHGEAGNPSRKSTPEDPVYIIYTSGTTGEPKGVEVPHRGVVNYTLWRIEKYNLTPAEATLQLLSYCFDGYASNLFSSLLSGGALVIVDEANVLNMNHVLKVIKSENVSFSSMTPGIFGLVLGSIEDNFGLGCLRGVVLGGEKVMPQLVHESKTKLPHVVLFNEYGPSEASIGATCKVDLDDLNTRIIGRPIWNTSIYILDESEGLMPLGVTGELCISGKGVAHCYLNDNELTGKKFVNDPFCEGERMFKTGDMARWLPDGNLEFLGRMDHQIKIRGIRIEPGELESQLVQHKAIKDAVVVVKEKSGSSCLAAYYISDENLSSSSLRTYLAQKLPENMLPTHYVQLAQFPLTSNGKLDHNALPFPGLTVDQNFVAAKTTIEKKLVEIWSETLKIDSSLVGINRSFFELGGHSLDAVFMVNKLASEFGINVPLKIIFNGSGIKEVARFIEAFLTDEKSDKPIDQARELIF